MVLYRSACMLGLRLAMGDWARGSGRCTVVVDAHAVVEGLFLQLLSGVVEDCVCERRGGEGNAVNCLGLWRWETCLVDEEGGDRARLGDPAVGFEGCWGGHGGGKAGAVESAYVG